MSTSNEAKEPEAKPREEWPGEVLDNFKYSIAIAVVPLLLHPRLWIHRRVESIAFLDVSRLMRRVSVDFTVPALEEIPVKLPNGHEIAFVPLSLLAKRVLKNFDLFDESGSALTVLTQEQNTVIAEAILNVLAGAVLSRKPDQPLVHDLTEIAGGEPEEAMEALANFSTPMGPGSHDQRRALWANEAFRTLSTDLAHQFMLIVPLRTRPGDRRVVKFAYEEEFFPRDRSLAQWFGLTPVEFGIFAPNIGGAASYHIEIEAPDELVIAQADLFDLRDDGLVTLDSERTVFRSHLHRAGLPRGSVGWVEVAFRLRRSGLVIAALLIAIATAIVLGGGLMLDLMGVNATVDIAATLLVALPGIYATYLARPGEHRLVKRLVGGLRVLVLLLAVLSFGAAASLSVDLGPRWRPWLWGFGAVVSLTAVVLIAAGLVASKWRDTHPK
jgi:hypothetical protein